MRAFETGRRARSYATSPRTIAALLLAACAPDLPTSVTRAVPEPLPVRSTAPTYASTSLGALPGDASSRANAVNDAGEVVGYSCCSAGNRAFVRQAGVLVALPGIEGNALAIGNGATRYVVGWAGSPSQPVRWTLAGNPPGPPTALALGTATWGAARAVNAAGQSVGNAGADAAMWDADGNLTLVPTPAGFTRGEGRGIDDAGHAVFVFSRSDPAWPDGVSVGYLRLASGELVELPPAVTDGISYANGLTNEAGGLLRVAGTRFANPSSPRAVRWTVDVALRQVVSVEERPEASHAVSIGDDGATTGFTEGQSHSLTSSAFLWQGSQLQSLTPPRGAKDGKGWGISPNGRLVAGEAIVRLGRIAVLWSFPAP